MKPNLNMWRSVAGIVSAAWLISLLLPVTPETKLYGIYVLALGWSGISEGQFGWLGNLSLAWTITLLILNKAPTQKVALLSAFLIIGPLVSSFWWSGAGGMETQEAEQNLTYGPGRYLWIVSLVFAAAAVVLQSFAKRGTAPAED